MRARGSGDCDALLERELAQVKLFLEAVEADSSFDFTHCFTTISFQSI
jgi:hypothetical protein